MMYYLESDSTDPYFNLALEQLVFDRLDPQHEYFMLWRNDNAIIVGKHQNTAGEIDAEFVREKGIRVVRRLSGGGTVYHDLGNVNFTFIVSGADKRAFDFGTFCRPVVRALAQLGVTAEINGRNDMTIDGKKFSGNAQYRKRGRVMHHGTILYDSDLSVLGKALVVPKDKIESKGLKSVQSRVANVKDYMAEDIGVARFMAELRAAMFREYEMRPYALTEEDLAEARRLQREVYATWAWNYGESPAYSIRKERRVEGCGKIEVHMDVTKGAIARIAFFGDYFGNAESADLCRLLQGAPLERESLRAALSGVEIGAYFHNLDLESFLAILTE
ncbi:MAG: lipoate--protein ligase [Rhodospirillaceae bacterium]